MLILSFDCTNKTVNQKSNNSGINEPKWIKGGQLNGFRSRASVMRGIVPNFKRMRELYNEEFKNKAEHTINIITNFKIDYLGNVISSEITESNSNSQDFDFKLLSIVKSMKFGPTDHIGDTTIVTYPLKFIK
jgi:mannose/fructose/N-acetylgalactosamine-specific phosphotransferase system component IID